MILKITEISKEDFKITGPLNRQLKVFRDILEDARQFIVDIDGNYPPEIIKEC